MPHLLDRRVGAAKVRGTPELAFLSDREFAIFSLIGRGFPVSRVAQELGVSVKTVETYEARLKQKLGLQSKAELRQRALKWLRAAARATLNGK